MNWTYPLVCPDGNGYTSSLTDPDSNTTSWEYNAYGQAVEQTNSSGTSYSQYDSAGELTQSTDADARAIVYNFNGVGQETSENWYSTTTTSGSPTETLSYVYNSAGMLTSAEDQSFAASTDAIDTYSYDAEGRVTSETQQIPGVSSIVTLNDQYTDGNRTQLATAIGSTNDFVNNYEYTSDPTNNLFGQMSQVTQSSNGGNSVTTKNVTFGYNLAGQFAAVARYAGTVSSGNEVTTGTYAYDTAGRLDDLRYAHGGTMTDGFHMVYTAAGDISDFYVYADASGTPTSSYTTWGDINQTYDATHQLTAYHTVNNSNYSASKTLSYDANGNVEVSGATNSGIGADNEATATPVSFLGPAYTYQYDADGNCILQAPSSGAVTAFRWDNRNRLTEVDTYASMSAYTSHATPLQTVLYVYDSFNRWLGETVTTHSGGTSTVTLQREFAYDGNNIALAFDGSGTLTERYLWGAAVDQVLAQESPANSGDVDWMMTDNQGSVRDVVTSTGSAILTDQHETYDPFGGKMWQTNLGNPVDILFGAYGRPYDETTGMQNDLNRWYNPTMRRFMSQDPSGLGPDVNPYRYCGNDPTGAMDPSGLGPVGPHSYLPQPVPPSWQGVGRPALGGCPTPPASPTPQTYPNSLPAAGEIALPGTQFGNVNIEPFISGSGSINYGFVPNPRFDAGSISTEFTFGMTFWYGGGGAKYSDCDINAIISSAVPPFPNPSVRDWFRNPITSGGKCIDHMFYQNYLMDQQNRDKYGDGRDKSIGSPENPTQRY